MKLYWRFKKKGKWTWKPAEVDKHWSDDMERWVYTVTEEDEE